MNRGYRPRFRVGLLLAGICSCSSSTPKPDAAARDHAIGDAASRKEAAVDRTKSNPDAIQLDRASPDKVGGSGKTCQASLGCQIDGDCLAKGLAFCEKGQCISCRKDTDCPKIFKGCDTSRGSCQLCRVDTDCVISGSQLGTGKCDPSIWNCTRCDGDTDCSNVTLIPTTPICATAGSMKTCVGCKKNDDCAKAQLKGCDTGLGVCSRCTSDAECCFAPGLPCNVSCNQSSGLCECTTDAQCQSTYGPVMSCKPAQ